MKLTKVVHLKMGTYGKCLSSHLPISEHAVLLSVAMQQVDIEQTFNFAIKVLSVSKNSPAVRCDVACWSSICLTAEKGV